jgi:hypothetical protein
MFSIFIILLSVLLLFSFRSNAQETSNVLENVDYKIERNLITYDGKFKVTFSFSDYLKGLYYVRPILSNGNVEIYNPASKEWVKSGEVWSKMPMLDNELFLKISSLEQKDHILNFDLMNTKDSSISKLSEKTIYGKKVYDNYVGSVNMSLKNVHYLDETAVNKDPLWVQTDTNNLSVSPKGLDEKISFIWVYVSVVSAFLLLLTFFLLLLKRQNRVAFN